MNLAQQLIAAGLPCFPCRSDKEPAVPKGTSWRDESLRPAHERQWSRSGVVGVPVPQGTVILDLDTYKGVTREQVDAALGLRLPWDAAQIQVTQNGGQHYAFRCSWPVRQTTDLMGVTGLDTRTAGKGYIATGAGYYATNQGVMSLAMPNMLPELPEATRHLLEEVKHAAEPKALPEGDRDVQAVREALSYISPACDRTEWVRIGLALRNYFHDDPYTGGVIYNEWSDGTLGNVDTPVNYSEDTIETQWYSFGAEGDTTIATVFHRAIESGWNPPRGIDTALAFGPGAASEDEFGTLIDRIIASGGDPKSTNELIAAVQGMTCNELQRGMLKAALQRELKDAGLLTKDVKATLEGKAAKAPRAPGTYANNHTENAAIFLTDRYPGDTLVRSEQVWYSYDGMIWNERTDDEIKSELAIDMSVSSPQASTVSGTFSMMLSLCNVSRKIGETPNGLVIVQNGVLDLTSGALLPHDKSLFTTNILPYNYNIQARCPSWVAFLDSVFEGDRERIALLQEWFGYMMTTSYEHQKIMLMPGPKRCGKGTIGRVMNMLVGDENYSGGTLLALTDDSFIHSLVNKTVMFIGDVAKKVPVNVSDQVTERLKNIAGQDKVPIKRKYLSNLDAYVSARITIAGNHIPKLFDDSGALASRLLVLPFEVSFYNREDLTLFDRLQQDIEGIAMWSLQGLARLKQNGRFTTPQASNDEIEYINESFSPLNQFIKEACELGTRDAVTSTELYNTYTAWCVTHQEDSILTRRTFTAAFKDGTRGKGTKYGPHRFPEGICRGFKGVTITHPVNTGSIPLHAVK